MAGATHPFFGNRYTNGGHIIGSFKFPEGLTMETVEHIAKIAVPETVTPMAKAVSSVHKASPLETMAKAGTKNKWVLPTIIIAIIAAVSGYLAYRHFKKKGIVKVPNVGICEHCGEPLTGARLVADGENPYIVCKKCGEKNYAKYHNEENEPTNNNSENRNDK
jgi:hypothetical protein